MKMRTTLTVIAAAVGLAFSASALADAMSKTEYKSARDKIESEYKSARTACDSMQGNAKDICFAEAKGREDVAMAELDVASKPGRKSRYALRIAKANAQYHVAREKCDDLAGNAKDVCVKQAKAARTSTKADARTDNKIAEAHKEAAADKRDADYAVAKEKCDALAGEAQEHCVKDAKALYGKS